MRARRGSYAPFLLTSIHYEQLQLSIRSIIRRNRWHHLRVLARVAPERCHPSQQPTPAQLSPRGVRSHRPHRSRSRLLHGATCLVAQQRHAPAQPARGRGRNLIQGACHRASGAPSPLSFSSTLRPQLIAVFFPLLSPLFLIRRVLPVDGFVSDECQDGHIDLAWLMRLKRSNNATAIDLDKPTIGHVDIPRLRAGHVGGFFWCVNLLSPSKCHLSHSRLTGRYTYLVQKILARIQEKTFSRQPRACGRFSLSLCYIHKMNRLSAATRWNR